MRGEPTYTGAGGRANVVPVNKKLKKHKQPDAIYQKKKENNPSHNNPQYFKSGVADLKPATDTKTGAWENLYENSLGNGGATLKRGNGGKSTKFSKPSFHGFQCRKIHYSKRSWKGKTRGAWEERRLLPTIS